ncbi:hypothetical protein H6G64_34065 [Calothrix sp. FACHB-156]|nr:hypothetical protein [Calothrix sp. FACHB-156]
MTTSANKYLGQAILGFIGIALIASPLFLKLPSQFQSFNATARIEQSEDVERSRIEQRQLTALKLAQTQVMPNTQKLKIRQYIDNPKRDPRPETTGWLESEVVYVYDSAGACIGRISARQWQWKYHYKNACNDAPD